MAVTNRDPSLQEKQNVCTFCLESSNNHVNISNLYYLEVFLYTMSLKYKRSIIVTTYIFISHKGDGVKCFSNFFYVFIEIFW